MRTDGICAQGTPDGLPVSCGVNSSWDQTSESPLRTETLGAHCSSQSPSRDPPWGLRRWFAPYLVEHGVVGAQARSAGAGHLETKPVFAKKSCVSRGNRDFEIVFREPHFWKFPVEESCLWPVVLTDELGGCLTYQQFSKKVFSWNKTINVWVQEFMGFCVFFF